MYKVILIVAVDGFIKPHSPGSLLEPATTYLFPDNWKAIPISFGLIMCKLVLSYDMDFVLILGRSL